ncbi:alpha/beta hydrolase [Actinocrispum sp. NPDC049592]|uniref:alpha/beta fold hydrolase n=1 Tax=Actinocrispum sp. NPDC049592 TaxID=3154835 RepID=UPI003412CB62
MYVTVNGVKTWHSVSGSGEPVLLLHGGFSDSREFEPNLATLDGFTLYRMDRRGHGRTPDVDGPITFGLMAADAIAFIEEVIGGPAHVVGYSAGGFVAGTIAMRRPDLIRKLVLISTAVTKEGWLFLPQEGGEMPAQVVDAYAEVSPDGRDHFPVMMAKVIHGDGTDPDPVEPGRIANPTLVMTADDDIVHLGHMIETYRAIPHGQLAVIPGASHLLMVEKPTLCTQLVADFLTNEPQPLMPVRRALSGPHEGGHGS